MARRSRGAGAVFQRADGRWEVQLRIGPNRRRSLYAQTRPDVLAKLEQARWSMALGLPVRMPVTRTLAEFLGDWLEVTKGRVQCSTFENYAFNVRRYVGELQDLGRADNTVRGAFLSLKCMCNGPLGRATRWTRRCSGSRRPGSPSV